MKTFLLLYVTGVRAKMPVRVGNACAPRAVMIPATGSIALQSRVGIEWCRSRSSAGSTISTCRAHLIFYAKRYAPGVMPGYPPEFTARHPVIERQYLFQNAADRTAARILHRHEG